MTLVAPANGGGGLSVKGELSVTKPHDYRVRVPVGAEPRREPVRVPVRAEPRVPCGER